MKISIHDYQGDDFSGLCQLMNHWDKDHPFTENDIKTSLSAVIQNPGGKILIAKSDGEIVGYAQVMKCYYLGFEPFIEVVQLLVAENQRSLGIGGLLMKRIEEEAQKENFHSIKLHSQVQRSRAHVFYEKLGYQYYKISKFYEKKLY